jgi:hypothetical protein
MVQNNSRYFTKDTLLATWLYMNGLKLEEVTKDDPAQLVFNCDSKELKDIIDQFNEGSPHGNIITFFRSYKILLSKIKER